MNNRTYLMSRAVAARKTAKAWLDEIAIPRPARTMQRQDRAGLRAIDPGPERCIADGVAWLCRAQDRSASRDGGVARHYSLVEGWSNSYPETTGYIAETFLDYGGEIGSQ